MKSPLESSVIRIVNLAGLVTGLLRLFPALFTSTTCYFLHWINCSRTTLGHNNLPKAKLFPLLLKLTLPNYLKFLPVEMTRNKFGIIFAKKFFTGNFSVIWCDCLETVSILCWKLQKICLLFFFNPRVEFLNYTSPAAKQSQFYFNSAHHTHILSFSYTHRGDILFNFLSQKKLFLSFWFKIIPIETSLSKYSTLIDARFEI